MDEKTIKILKTLHDQIEIVEEQRKTVIISEDLVELALRFYDKIAELKSDVDKILEVHHYQTRGL